MMIYSPRQLANHLKFIRQQNGWTQSELAGRVGLKQATVSHFENNPDKATMATFFKVLQSLEQEMILQAKGAAGSTSGKEIDW